MRHRHGLRKLNCTSAHRKAKFTALCNALIEHGAITTTLPKAKSLRKVIEPLITLARKPSVANRRLAFSRLNNRKSVTILFEEIGPRYKDRPGGYTRVLKKGFRTGDAAPMALVELVDRKKEVAKADAPAQSKAAKPSKPSKPSKPKASEAQPVAEAKPSAEARPAVESKPVEESKPAVASESAEASKPAAPSEDKQD